MYLAHHTQDGESGGGLATRHSLRHRVVARNRERESSTSFWCRPSRLIHVRAWENTSDEKKAGRHVEKGRRDQSIGTISEKSTTFSSPGPPLALRAAGEAKFGFLRRSALDLDSIWGTHTSPSKVRLRALGSVARTRQRPAPVRIILPARIRRADRGGWLARSQSCERRRMRLQIEKAVSSGPSQITCGARQRNARKNVGSRATAARSMRAHL